MNKITVIIAALLLAACTNPYANARTTILAIRSGMAIAETGYLAYEVGEKAKCDKLGKRGESAYDKCMADVTKKRATFDKSKRNVYDGLDVSEKIVDLAEKAGKLDFTGWIEPAKTAVCFLDGIINWLPTKWQDNATLKLVRGFVVSWAGGCKR